MWKIHLVTHPCLPAGEPASAPWEEHVPELGIAARIGMREHPAAWVGKVETTIIFSDFAPYLRVGYGSPSGDGSGVLVDPGPGEGSG